MPTSHRHSRADKKRQSCAKKQKEPLGLISHAMQNSDRQIALPVSRHPVFRLTRRSNISFARDMQGNEQCQCSHSQVVSPSAKAFNCEAGGRHFLNIQIGRSSRNFTNYHVNSNRELHRHKGNADLNHTLL